MLISNQSNFMIREASAEDLSALVQVHVISWNATYPDYYPKPPVELRTRQWQKHFTENNNNWFCYVAENDKHGIVGFATGHDFDDSELPYKGQLDKIHILHDYKRRGLGKQLVCMVVEHFLKDGIHSMVLFADPPNPHIAFYDKLGGERLCDGQGVFHGAFGWRDITVIRDLCK